MSRSGVGAIVYYILSFRCLSFGCGLNTGGCARGSWRIADESGPVLTSAVAGDRRLHADRESAAAETSARSAPVGGRLFVPGMGVLRSAGKKFLPAILFPYLWHSIPPAMASDNRQPNGTTRHCRTKKPACRSGGYGTPNRISPSCAGGKDGHESSDGRSAAGIPDERSPLWSYGTAAASDPAGLFFIINY